jgi:RNA recognition motif-containing protein
MKKSIYIGNLPFTATETEIHDLFIPFSPVYGVKIILDREAGRSRGFAFVEVDADKAEAAIKGLDGKDMKGRPLKVNEARYRAQPGAAAP